MERVAVASLRNRGGRPGFFCIRAQGHIGVSRRHPLYAERLQDLAELCIGLGDLDRATSLMDQATALTEGLLGPEHPHYAVRLGGTARLLAARHDLDGARRVAQRALALSREAWGEGHLVPTTAARSLARIHLMRGEPAIAKSLLSDQLAAVRAAGRQSQPDQPGLLSDLADALIALGETDAARPLLDQALVLNDSLLGHDHPSNEAILDRLCLWRQSRGDARQRPEGCRHGPGAERALPVPLSRCPIGTRDSRRAR